ncbi:RTC4-like domain-containing protein [Pseudomassariella vexata]|uniref:Restriction of telomere capping protein 4 n=1 Tax=Pseudomassariella vexata TaxID=1141098 RepID=A0A1Y2E5W7_9PEZI|nr:RTC4-like domain-containing protein [Pseudomassariella vexata]ORY66265.1 RTC4-like domain-domain-containing protein [Pseudomassariella vexata]
MSYSKRHIGFSRHAHAPSLLKTVQGKVRAPGPRRPKKDVADDAPPMSSSDEDESFFGPTVKNEPSGSGNHGTPTTRYDSPHAKYQKPMTQKESVDSDSDDEIYSLKQNIKPTIFSSRDKSKQGDTSVNYSKPPTTRRSTAQASSASSKRSAQEMCKDSADHMTNDIGFVKSQSSKKGRASYGKASQKPPQRLAKSKVPREESLSPKKAFKRPQISLSPSPQKPTAPKRTQGPFVAEYSPMRNPAPSRYRPPMLPSDDWPAPEKGVRTKVKPNSDDSTESDQSSKSSIRGVTTNRIAEKKTRARKQKSLVSKEESPPRPVFRRFIKGADLDDDVKEALSTHALKLLDNASDREGTGEALASGDESGSDISIEDTQLFGPRCPMCHAPVDPDMLKKHSNHGRMNIKQQTSFCRLHKRKSAQRDRSAQGYPDIDWVNLEVRLIEHETFIKDILQGARSSYYASLLNDKVDTGQNRTLLKTDDSLTPGYYGPRGLRVMTEFIMRTFSDTVRKRAVEDRLVSARGYTGYVQAVLVPELAIRLIMEDMKVGEEDARVILRDTVELGDFLHEEARDVVVKASDDEED